MVIFHSHVSHYERVPVCYDSHVFPNIPIYERETDILIPLIPIYERHLLYVHLLIWLVVSTPLKNISQLG